MKRLQIFDPPMCCSTGVCGPSVDPTLTRFAADLDWLRRQGFAIERFNLAQEPGVFASDSAVKGELAEGGTAVLPLVLVDRQIVGRGDYPSRAQLAALVGLPADLGNSAAALPVVDSACCGSDGCC